MRPLRRQESPPEAVACPAAAQDRRSAARSARQARRDDRPASRPASFLNDVIDLSARLGTLLVVLCSRQTRSTRSRSGSQARPARVRCSRGPARVRDSGHAVARPHRRSSRSERRSRQRPQHQTQPRAAPCPAERLDARSSSSTTTSRSATRPHSRDSRGSSTTAQIAAWSAANSPTTPSSATRVGWRTPQDNFVSGSVLGVHCWRSDAPFFPDVYNELVLLLKAVARHELQRRESDTNPVRALRRPTPGRSRRIRRSLAEGMYALIGDVAEPEPRLRPPAPLAPGGFWEDFVEARLEAAGPSRATASTRSARPPRRRRGGPAHWGPGRRGAPAG